jgi:hypothetical protein
LEYDEQKIRFNAEAIMSERGHPARIDLSA